MLERITEDNELIDALRWCGDENNEWCVRETYKCPLWNEDRITDERKAELMTAAADAIERLVAEVDRKDKAIQGLLDAVDKKNTKIDLWKAAWKTVYKLYEATKESKGEQDGTEQNR